ncbi:NADP-dependent oxidoreductase [Tengunoibacter tsumagoiensis]|uniref:NADP-dependent oxidoreductase n=1 Tax=Tengunoibacter tsumagoiensis TaxID=2014871 RepID=A0A402AA80_9CHLR|nr:NADP-dependent oxidoreductase [Tengunoibacter tsumagoiensis]GCE16073.1 NADP-dependent oxidoreductase [Tengunoibacter tsumagoiensis]
MSIKNRQVQLASRPEGWVKESDFRIVETDVPAIGQGEVLVKNLYLSLDPYMRGRMSAAKSYAAGMELGDVMVGGTVGTILESNHPEFKAGDTVVGYLGWQLYAVSKGEGLRTVSTNAAPVSTYLGVLGMPGLTAWIGLIDIGQPKAGETVVVSAASGAVGSVVGQLAKARGCRAVGIAGGKAKCDYVVNELGFDACVDYKAGNLAVDLQAAAPDGIDIYFENVGGPILDVVLTQLNAFARIPLCGFISQYNVTEPYAIKHFSALLTNRVKLQGFIVGEHAAHFPQALDELGKLVTTGKLKYRETIANGLENAPKAFIGMLKGENFGKQLVKLA